MCRTIRQLPGDALQTTTIAGENVSHDNGTGVNESDVDSTKDRQSLSLSLSLPHSDSEQTSNGCECCINVVSPPPVSPIVAMQPQHRCADCSDMKEHPTKQHHQSWRPSVRLVHLDCTLRIHSLESSSSKSFLDIRATLLQIRDSLSPTTPPNGKHRHAEILSSSSTSPRGRLDVGMTSGGEDEDKDAAAARTRTRRQQLASRRNRSRVKFADDFGLNLITFVLIPSRSSISSVVRAADVGDNVTCSAVPGASTNVGDRCNELFLPMSYLRCFDENDRNWMTMSDKAKMMMPASGLYRRRMLDRPPARGSTADNTLDESDNATPTPSNPAHSINGSRSLCGVAETADGVSSSVATVGAPSSFIHDKLQFRLCFDQPYADHERFRARLSTQMVCLENVRVLPRSPKGSTAAATSSTSSPSVSPPLVATTNNHVVLCTIRSHNLHPKKLVFARCTVDDWVTYADLPAHQVGGIDSLGYRYNRFCFVVHRPLFKADVSSEGSGTAVDETFARRPSAVEFAVCFQAVGKTYWDSNDGSNFRIEWC